ncbi:MAG: hypothetical protein KF831_01210 [Acidobacteria bacterium]|nr:hypothetical protein [Acidobacteriota bacterium]
MVDSLVPPKDQQLWGYRDMGLTALKLRDQEDAASTGARGAAVGGRP